MPQSVIKGSVYVRAFLPLFAACLTLFFASNAAAQGEATFKKRCVTCHGANGDGNGHANMKIQPADLRSDAVQKHSDEELYKSIAFGVGHKEYAHAFAERGMPPKQISEVVSYIRTLAPKKNR